MSDQSIVEATDAPHTQARIESLSDAEVADEVARIFTAAGHQEERYPSPAACAASLRRHVLGISRAWDRRYAPEGVGAGIMLPPECLTMLAAADALIAEREACAMVAEGSKPHTMPIGVYGQGWDAACDHISAAIRARSDRVDNEDQPK